MRCGADVVAAAGGMIVAFGLGGEGLMGGLPVCTHCDPGSCVFSWIIDSRGFSVIFDLHIIISVIVSSSSRVSGVRLVSVREVFEKVGLSNVVCPCFKFIGGHQIAFFVVSIATKTR